MDDQIEAVLAEVEFELDFSLVKTSEGDGRTSADIEREIEQKGREQYLADARKEQHHGAG